MSIYNSISKFINLSIYNSIFADILQMGYAHGRRTRKITDSNAKYYINMLIKNNIIKPHKLTKTQQLDLLCQTGMNSYNVSRIKAYKLTNRYDELFNQQTIKHFILNKITYIQEDKKKKFLFDVNRKLSRIKQKQEIKLKLQNININSVSNHYFKRLDWSNYGINNAYDFFCIKIRKICEYIPFSKTGFQRLEQKLCGLIGTNIEQLRTVITSRYKTEKWEKINFSM